MQDLTQQFQPKAYSRAGGEEINHDRWLVSYADFMTLLMAFFVVMYSISQVSEQKYRVLSETFSQAFNTPIEVERFIEDGEPQLSYTVTPIDLEGHALEDRPGNDANSVPETFVRISEQLEQSFQTLIEKELIAVTGDERWLQIELPSAVLFGSGGVELSEVASAIVDELATALGQYENVIRVEGFTDDVPINTPEFASNWELSTARASVVVKMLAEKGIDPQRLAAVGYGEFQPVESNSTEEGRSKNRRIVLMVSTQHQLRPKAEVVQQIDAEDVRQEIVYEYANRDPLPEGTLVRGLDASALDEARAWLAQRYAVGAETAAATDSAAGASELTTSTEDVADRSVDITPAQGIQRIQLENGALLFTSEAR